MTTLRHLWRATVGRRHGGESGVTLVELLVVISIASTIVLVIGAAFSASARTSMAANTRLRESHDAQMLNAYFTADAEGVSAFSLSAPACASGVPAGSSPVASFAWADGSGVARSAYYYTTARVAGVAQLQRRFCDNGIARPSDVTLGRNIASTSVVCDPACSGVPTGVALTVVETSTYSYTVRVSPRSAVPTGTFANAPVVRSIRRVGSSSTNATQVQYSVSFSGAVTGVNVGPGSDFFLSPTVAGASIAQLIGVGGGASYVVVVNIGAATTGTVGLNLANDGTIKDRTPQTLTGNFTGETYTVDKVAPTVSTMVLHGASPTNTGPLSWTVTFSEPVSNVVAADFALQTTGASGTAPSITSVAPSGTAPTATWTVTAGTTGAVGANGATVLLKLVDKGTIRDPATNALGGTVPITGQQYVYDTTRPSLSSVAPAAGQADPTRTLPLNFTVVFDEPVSGLTGPEVAVSGTAPGSKTVTVTPATGSATTYNLAVDGVTGAGTVIVKVNADTALDAAGNGNNASTTTAQVSFDPNLAVPPLASDIQGQSAGSNTNRPSSGDKVTYTFDQTMSAPSIKTGWDGTSTTVTARFTRAAGNPTKLVVMSGPTTLNLGTVDLGDETLLRYMNSGTTIDVTATMVMTTVSGRSVLVLTLTATNTNFTPGDSSTSLLWTPSTAARSSAGVAMSAAAKTQINGPKQNF